MGAGMARILVTFDVDADGILHVSAEETTTGKRASIEVKPSYGLEDDVVEKMIMDSFEHAEDDVTKKVLTEARIEGQRILAALGGALAEDADLLEPHEKEEIDAAVANVAEAMAGDSARAISDAIEKLDETSAEFAVRRMNKSIRAALAGQSADRL
jgi:molecular chaperone HscA